MKRKVIKIMVIASMAILLIGFIATTYYTGSQVAEGLIYQNRGNDTQSNSLEQLKLWNFNLDAFYDNNKIYSHQILAEDGVEINYYTINQTAIKDQNTVILVHGLGGDHVSTFLHSIMYLEEGWQVVTFDQRGTKNSNDEKVSFGYFESLDLKALVDELRNDVQASKLMIHGFSMGAATTGLYASTDHGNKNIDGIILDSSFESMESTFRMYWEHMGVPLPASFAVWSGEIFLKKDYKFSFEDADLKNALKDCNVPVLVIQCKQDDIVPLNVGQALYDAASAEYKKLWVVDAKHIEAYIDHPSVYHEKVFNFIRGMDEI